MRENFRKKIRDLIAKRAGYFCSYPGCNTLLIGPSNDANKYTELGECAHIFSASKEGPRGRGHLKDEDLCKVENGIYLCKKHHKIIDSSGEDYSSDVLLQYKNRHEFFISAKLGNLQYPLMWIEKINIVNSPVFKNLNINLGKLTLLHGPNGSGKSMIMEILAAIFSKKIYQRWDENKFLIKIKMDNPITKEVTIEIKNKIISYYTNSNDLPFFPYDLDLIYIRSNDDKLKPEKDNINYIANFLNLSRDLIRTIIKTTGVKHGLRTKKIFVTTIRRKPYKIEKLLVDFDDKVNWDFDICSYSEKSSIILDIILSYAINLSKFKPVLLLIDWLGFHQFDPILKEKYLKFINENSYHFQTIIASHDISNFEWDGWVAVELQKK